MFFMVASLVAQQKVAILSTLNQCASTLAHVALLFPDTLQ